MRAKLGFCQPTMLNWQEGRDWTFVVDLTVYRSTKLRAVDYVDVSGFVWGRQLTPQSPPL